jgi:hypothetical protein
VIAGHRQNPQRDLLALQSGDNAQQITDRAGESVDFRYVLLERALCGTIMTIVVAADDGGRI